MKKILFTIFLGLSVILSAQKIDYNLDGGYMANGYDVVAYFSKSPKKGNKSYTATYNGVKYKFSSQSNLNKFKTNPKKYVPQYGGYCAYAMADRGEKVSIDPTSYEIRDGKLFLFYKSWSYSALKKWKNNSPSKLIVKADKNWAKVKYKK